MAIATFTNKSDGIEAYVVPNGASRGNLSGIRRIYTWEGAPDIAAFRSSSAVSVAECIHCRKALRALSENARESLEEYGWTETTAHPFYFRGGLS